MTRPKIDDVVTDFKDTGPCHIDCDVVEKLWAPHIRPALKEKAGQTAIAR